MISNDMTNLIERVSRGLRASAELKVRTAETCSDSIVKAAQLIAETFQRDGKVLLCGNGGSAADCQHTAAEFVSRFRRQVERRALPALALTTDTSFLTAFTNDCGYDSVFERQVEAFGRPGDVLIGISTSGNSVNVEKALRFAASRGLTTIGLTGSRGVIPTIVDIAIAVPSTDTQQIQETHLAIEHAICDLVEVILFEPLVKAAETA